MIRQADLFNALPVKAKDSTQAVRLELEYVDETAMAWLLRKPGQRAKWAPKKHVTRGEGAEERVFTMPRWAAEERGWL